MPVHAKVVRSEAAWAVAIALAYRPVGIRPVCQLNHKRLDFECWLQSGDRLVGNQLAAVAGSPRSRDGSANAGLRPKRAGHR